MNDLQLAISTDPLWSKRSHAAIVDKTTENSELIIENVLLSLSVIPIWLLLANLWTNPIQISMIEIGVGLRQGFIP